MFQLYPLGWLPDGVFEFHVPGWLPDGVFKFHVPGWLPDDVFQFHMPGWLPDGVLRGILPNNVFEFHSLGLPLVVCFSFIRLADYLIVNTMHVLAVNSVSTLLNYLTEQLQNTPTLAQIQGDEEEPEEEEKEKEATEKVRHQVLK